MVLFWWVTTRLYHYLFTIIMMFYTITVICMIVCTQCKMTCPHCMIISMKVIMQDH